MPSKKVNWASIRKLFPATKKYTYLNAAAAAPISTKAAKAAKEFYDEMLMQGDLAWDNWQKRLEKARKQIAKFINADPSEIAFTLNTSHGMNMIAELLKGKGGVLTHDDEFPSSTLPWIHHGYKVNFVKPVNHIYSLESIEKSIKKNTRILVSSYVQYSTGFRQDLIKLGQLCQKKKLTYVVNATQAVAVLPIDVQKAKVDFLVFNSFKWPMAGYGAGVLYINKKYLKKLHSPIAGWRSVNVPGEMDNKSLDLKKEASRLEVGCPHFAPIFALGAAMDLFAKLGQKNIQNRIMELNDYLSKKLTQLGLEVTSPAVEQYRSGIVIIKVAHPKLIAKKLAQKKIIVSPRGEGIRTSVHIYNNKKDLDIFVKALKALLS